MAKNNWLASRWKTKLLALEHTGRLRPHQHTSYAGLLFIIGLAIIPITLTQRTAAADQSVGVSTAVPSPIPTAAPHITNLVDGKTLTTNDSITVTGTCQANSDVRIFKNDVLAGSASCHNGSFSLPIDLFIGSNSLVARAYSADNIPGPESLAITVNLQPPGVSGITNGSTAAGQFYITSDVYYRGVSPRQNLTWPLSIAGGQAPYAVTISWGDGITQQLSRGATGPFTASHIYNKPADNGGDYTVVVQATDQKGATALLQLSAVVPGSGSVSTTTTSSSGHSGWTKFQIAWQSIILMTAIVLSFWVGERRELRILRQHTVGLV